MSNRRLLEPGWPGDPADDELAYIQQQLLADKKLSHRWGFAPPQKTRPLEAIRRVAIWGSPNHRSVNVSLARPRKGSQAAIAGVEVPLGRPKLELAGLR